MYKTCLSLILAWMGASAQASDALASRYACVACHQPAVKTVGPSWSDIAAKYADGSKSAEQLAASIKRGGSGNWGRYPCLRSLRFPMRMPWRLPSGCLASVSRNREQVECDGRSVLM